jgi:hypothetical protein
MQALDARFFFFPPKTWIILLIFQTPQTSLPVRSFSLFLIPNRFTLPIYLLLLRRPRENTWILVLVPYQCTDSSGLPLPSSTHLVRARSAEQSCLPNPSVEAQQQQLEEEEQLRDKPPAKPNQTLLLDPPHPHPNRPQQPVHPPHEHPCSASRL